MDGEALGAAMHLLRMASSQSGGSVAFLALARPGGGFAVTAFPPIGDDDPWTIESLEDLARDVWEDPLLCRNKVLVRGRQVMINGVWPARTQIAMVAAAPLIDETHAEGRRGLLCVADHVHGHFDQDQLDVLATLAGRIVAHLQAREQVLGSMLAPFETTEPVMDDAPWDHAFLDDVASAVAEAEVAAQEPAEMAAADSATAPLEIAPDPAPADEDDSVRSFSALEALRSNDERRIQEVLDRLAGAEEDEEIEEIEARTVEPVAEAPAPTAVVDEIDEVGALAAPTFEDAPGTDPVEAVLRRLDEETVEVGAPEVEVEAEAESSASGVESFVSEVGADIRSSDTEVDVRDDRVEDVAADRVPFDFDADELRYAEEQAAEAGGDTAWTTFGVEDEAEEDWFSPSRPLAWDETAELGGAFVEVPAGWDEEADATGETAEMAAAETGGPDEVVEVSVLRAELENALGELEAVGVVDVIDWLDRVETDEVAAVIEAAPALDETLVDEALVEEAVVEALQEAVVDAMEDAVVEAFLDAGETAAEAAESDHPAFAEESDDEALARALEEIGRVETFGAAFATPVPDEDLEEVEDTAFAGLEEGEAAAVVGAVEEAATADALEGADLLEEAAETFEAIEAFAPFTGVPAGDEATGQIDVVDVVDEAAVEIDVVDETAWIDDTDGIEMTDVDVVSSAPEELAVTDELLVTEEPAVADEDAPYEEVDATADEGSAPVAEAESTVLEVVHDSEPALAAVASGPVEGLFSGIRPDPVTGLPGLPSFLGRLGQALGGLDVARAELAVVLLEIVADDGGGEIPNDATLAAVADRLREQVRRDDAVARVGSASFAVTAVYGVGVSSAEAIRQRLVAAVDEAIHWSPTRFAIRSAAAAADAAPTPGVDTLFGEVVDRLAQS